MTADLHFLTLQQPWAWAVAHAGKRVENRTWATGYRGLLAIHAGKTDDRDGWASRIIKDALRRLGRFDPVTRGAVVAVAQLIDCHRAQGDCCPPWGAPGQHHILLADVRPLTEPVPMRGGLGIRPVPADLIPLILERAA